MTWFPRHRVLRIIAGAWLLVSVALLAAALLRPEAQLNERAALSSLVPLYFMSLPLGHPGVVALGKLKLELYLASQFVPGIVAEALALWAVLTVLGYFQWFVLLPWASYLCRRLADFLFKRQLAR